MCMDIHIQEIQNLIVMQSKGYLQTFFFKSQWGVKSDLTFFSGPAFCESGFHLLFLTTLSIPTLEPGTCTWQLGLREKFPASYGYWTGAPPLSETGALTTELPVSTIMQNQHAWSFYLLEHFCVCVCAKCCIANTFHKCLKETYFHWCIYAMKSTI